MDSKKPETTTTTPQAPRATSKIEILVSAPKSQQGAIERAVLAKIRQGIRDGKLN